MTIEYAKIQKAKSTPFTGDPRRYMTVQGYTKRMGAPTDAMIMLEGETKWRRVRLFCVSNSGTLFVKTKDNPFLVVRDYELDNALSKKQRLFYRAGSKIEAIELAKSDGHTVVFTEQIKENRYYVTVEVK